MRVVHVNAYDGNGGAGRAVMRLHHALKQEGVHSDVLCLYQFQSASDVTPVYRTWLGKLRSIVCIFGERSVVNLLRSRRDFLFSLRRLGVRATNIPWLGTGVMFPLHGCTQKGR